MVKSLVKLVKSGKDGKVGSQTIKDRRKHGDDVSHTTGFREAGTENRAFIFLQAPPASSARVPLPPGPSRSRQTQVRDIFWV